VKNVDSYKCAKWYYLSFKPKNLENGALTDFWKKIGFWGIPKNKNGNKFLLENILTILGSRLLAQIVQKQENRLNPNL